MQTRRSEAETQTSQTSSSVVSRGAPRHYHLLWDYELDELRAVLEIVKERLDEVVKHWYQLYVLHFGDDRTLTEREFYDIFHAGLGESLAWLLDKDIDRYAVHTMRTGETLAERKVPFS